MRALYVQDARPGVQTAAIVSVSEFQSTFTSSDTGEDIASMSAEGMEAAQQLYCLSR
jgi:hypothetical protein